MGMSDKDIPKKMTASGAVFTGAGNITGMLVGTDGTNDPTITIDDSTDGSGTDVVPTTTYDASVLGLNGFMRVLIPCNAGAYITISNLGTGEVVCYYNRKYAF